MMGVMSCSKYGCDGIMCNRYSDEIGYICSECFSDLKEVLNHRPEMDLDDIRNWLSRRKNNIYEHINILVHTNMSNDVMENELKTKGANEIIGKVDMLRLSKSIEKYMI